MSRLTPDRSPESRRGAILAGVAVSAPLALSSASSAATSSDVPAVKGASSGKTITANDGARIFYKDWGKGQPIVFSHGWPLSSDAWDNQMLFFGQHGYRVVAHDRCSHGRSDQTWDGNNMDQFADDLAELIVRLDLRNIIIIGHSMGGGEVVRYIGRHGTKRVAKVVLVGVVPPLMLKTQANPEGAPLEVFDGIRKGVARDRSQFYKDLTMAAQRVLVAGHAGQHQGAIRLCLRIFGSGLHGGPQEDRQADADRSRRRRSDRSDQGVGREDRENNQGCAAEGVSRRLARAWPRQRPISSILRCWPSSRRKRHSWICATTRPSALFLKSVEIK